MGQHLSGLLGGAEVTIGSAALDPAVTDQLAEVRVDTHQRLPDSCTIRILDPKLELVDRTSFALGADLVVRFESPSGNAATALFDGQIASLEPEFERSQAALVIRAYDRSHKLNRTRNTNAYQQISYASIARQIAGSGGLSSGTIGDAGGTHAFVQQSNETDWEFLWRLADEIGFDVHVEGRRLHFRDPDAASAAPPKVLEWGKELRAFRPRVTAVQQVDSVKVRGWDPETKQPIESTAQVDPTRADIGIDQAAAASALDGGTVTIADRPVRTAAQALALAKSVASQLGEAYAEAEGLAVGDPAIKSGTKVDVRGIGTRFGGTYTITSTTHVLRGGSGYDTRFTVSGRSSRSLLGLAGGAPSRRPWGQSVAVGLVTNNNDPDQLGRVRVRYPVLGTDHEGWWARVTAPAAGTRRGLLMTPQVGDEVLIAFEHDDEEHPYVIGSVWNGTAKPQELVHPDGSFALRSDKQVLLEAAEPMTLTTDKALKLTAAGDTTITTNERSGQGAPGKVTVDAKGDANYKSGTATKIEGGTETKISGSTTVEVKAGTTLTIQGGGQVAIKGMSVQIQASGVVQVQGAQVLLG